MIRFTASALALLTLPASTTPAQTPERARTVVNDAAALKRLRANSGITLQWISFTSSRRGHVMVRDQPDGLHLEGMPQAADGPGRMELNGRVLRIGGREFTFQGRIVIADAPDTGRRCVRDGIFTFRVTGQRRYWRLQEMEACDGLTDYVDIYY
jgi:hypothetical protein